MALWDGVRGRSRRREHRHGTADPPLPQEEKVSKCFASPRTPDRPRQGTFSKPCAPPRKAERPRQVSPDRAESAPPRVGELSETAAELLDEAAGLLVEAASVQMISVNQASVSKDSDGSEPVESMELLSLAFKLEGEALRESKSRHELRDAWGNLVAEASDPASVSCPNSVTRRMSWAEDSVQIHVYQQVEDESFGVAQQSQTEPGQHPATGSKLPVTSPTGPTMTRKTSLRQLSLDGIAVQEQEQLTLPKVSEEPTIVDGDADGPPSASLAPAASLKPAADSRPPPTAGRLGGLRRSPDKGCDVTEATQDQSERRCALDEVQTMAMMDSSNVSVKPGMCCLSLFSCAACFEEAIDNMQ